MNVYYDCCPDIGKTMSGQLVSKCYLTCKLIPARLFSYHFLSRYSRSAFLWAMRAFCSSVSEERIRKSWKSEGCS